MISGPNTGEAIATFRTAAEILREHEGLIFNHNEAILYRWVERLDPALFEAAYQQAKAFDDLLDAWR